jgi:hypothetical protein
LERYLLSKGDIPHLYAAFWFVFLGRPHCRPQIKDAQLENGGSVTALPPTSGSDVDDILGSE